MNGPKRFISGRYLYGPSGDVGSAAMPESPKTTIRWDDGLKADAERCARERGIPVAEFIRQSIAHYVAWCAAARDSRENDQEPRG